MEQDRSLEFFMPQIATLIDIILNCKEEFDYNVSIARFLKPINGADN